MWDHVVGSGYRVRLWGWDVGSGFGAGIRGCPTAVGFPAHMLCCGATRPTPPPPPHRTGSFSGPWAPTTGTARCWRRAAAGAASPRGSGSAANSTPGRRSTRPTWVRGGPRAAGSCGANGGWKRRTAVRGGGARHCGAALGAVGQLWALWGRDAQCYGMALGAVGLGCSTLWGSTGRYGAALGTIG